MSDPLPPLKGAPVVPEDGNRVSPADGIVDGQLNVDPYAINADAIKEEQDGKATQHDSSLAIKEVLVAPVKVEEKVTIKDRIVAALENIEPLIAMEHRGEKMNDYTQFPGLKFKVKNFWAYVFSLFIIVMLIVNVIGQLKKMGSIIKIDSSKSYYESWTLANKTFCSKFPSNLKAQYNCGVKSRYDFNKKKAFKKKDVEGQAEIMNDTMIGVTMPLDMTIETDQVCDDYRISLVLDDRLVTLLKKKSSDFQTFQFDAKKFEYDQDEAPLTEEDGDWDDFGDDEGWGDDDEGWGDEDTGDDYYRRRLEEESKFENLKRRRLAFADVDKTDDYGYYTSYIVYGEPGFDRKTIGTYTDDVYLKTGWESYYRSDTNEAYYVDKSYTYSYYKDNLDLDKQTTGTTGVTINEEDGQACTKTKECKQPDCWSTYQTFFTETYMNPNWQGTDDYPMDKDDITTFYQQEVESSVNSVKEKDIVWPAPPGCLYTLSTKTIEQLLFNNSRLEFTSNFKEKAKKQAVYKIKVEQKKINWTEPLPHENICGTNYEKKDGKDVWELATSYRGKFKIKMKSIVPNYDFTVYNMKTEPQVRTVEKYYGGNSSCYFSCETVTIDWETPDPLTGEDYTIKIAPDKEIDDWSLKEKVMTPEPVLIELQRHHFNTPNLPAIFGVGAFAGNPKALSATIWEPTSTELSQHDFSHRIVDISSIEIVFGTALQKNTQVVYFGIGNVFSAFGGFLVSLKGVALIAYGFLFGAMVKKQLANLMYTKFVLADQLTEEEKKEKKELREQAWESNQIDRTRKKEMKILKKIKTQGQNNDQSEGKEEDMVDYMFQKLAYYGSNAHTFETETKLDVFQNVLVKLWKSKQKHEEAISKISGDYQKDNKIDISGELLLTERDEDKKEK